MMRRIIVVAALLLAAAASCKGKSSEGGGSATTPGSGSAGSAAPAKGDAEVAAALKLMAAVEPSIKDHKDDCAAMKAGFDPALAGVQAESKVVLDGMKDPDIAKRLADIRDANTPLGAAYKRTYMTSLDCPEVSDPLARAMGTLK